MKFTRILAYAAVYLLALTGFAAAEPISTAIGLIATTIGQLGAFGQLALSLAVSVGSSLLQRALTTKARQPGIKADIDVGGDNPLSFIIGTYATAGQLEYVNTSGTGGTPNEDLTLVISLSDLPVNALRPSLWVAGEKCTIDAALDPGDRGNQVAEYRTDGGTNNHLWVRFHDGLQTTADSFLLARYGSDPSRPWSSDMVGRGVSYAVVTAEIERELFTGPPECRFEIEGLRLYDPRKDSTVGGSGSHRFGNTATYEFSDNTAVVIFNILRGIYYDDEWVFGLQNLPATRLPLSNWFAAMNECDRLIPLTGGGSEKQFRCGAEIKVDEQPIDVINELLKGCNGRMAEIGGIYKIRVGAPTLPVYAFTDEAISITTGQSYDPFPGLETVYNGVNYSYPDPNAAWEMKDGPVRFNPALELLDDGQRLMADAQFNYVPFPVQAQRLAKALIENNRRFAQQKFTLPPEAYLLEPLDVVSYTSDRNGYISKLFDLESMDDLANVNQAVALKEVDPSDYDWTPGTDQMPTTIGFLGPIRPPAQLVTGWQVEPAILRDSAGNARRPSIEVFFAGAQKDVQGIRIQVLLAEDLSLVFDMTIPYDAPLNQPYSVVLNGVFLPNEDYLVHAMFVSKSDRAFAWTGLLAVHTDNVLLGSGDIYPGGLVDAVLSSLGNHLEWLAEGVHYARDELDRLNLIAADSGAQSTRDKKELLAEVGSANAKYSNEILVVAKANEAAVIRLEELNAAITDPETGLTANANAIDSLSVVVTDIDGELTAVANSVTSLTTTVGRFSATGLFRTTVEANAAGALATIGLSVSATGGGATSQAAMILSALAGGLSEIGFLADRIYMVNGASKRRPFIFSGGVLYLDDVKVNTLSALSATLGNVDISNAIIGNLIVGTSNLGFNSVTDKTSYSGGSTGTQGTWTAVATVPTQNPNPNPVFCEYGLTAISHANGGGAATSRIRWRRDGVVLKEVVAAATGTGGVPQDRTTQDIGFFIDDSPVQGTNTYVLEVFNELGGGTVNSSGYVKMIWWKR